MCKTGMQFGIFCLILLSTRLASGSALFEAKSPVSTVLDSLFATREFKEVAISPDGRRVAWVEPLKGKNAAPSPNSAIYLANLKSATLPPHRLSAGIGATPHAEHDLAWSPDGTRLAFLSDAERSGQLELYVKEVAGGRARKLTHLTGFLAAPQWSPDGKMLAFLFIENAPRAAGPLGPMTPPSGVIEEQVYEQRLATVDLATGSVREVSPADLYVYEYDWSPDGKRVVATAAHGPGDSMWYLAELYIIELASGNTKSILQPKAQVTAPRWSADGKTIAFIGGLMSDEGNPGGDIFAVPAAGGKARNLTPDIKASPSWLAWLPSNQILFAEQVDGESSIATLDPSNGKVTSLWRGAESNSTGGWSFGMSLAKDGKTCALLLQSFNQPPEVWAGAVGAWKQITHANQNLRPSWGEAKSIHWQSDGLSAQGWLIYPKNYDPGKRYPMVVSAHGGPGSMVRPHWPKSFYDMTVLSSLGYFVFYPNPRGSFGEGESFTQANVKDFGYGDLRDILAGTDEVVRTLPVDNNRIGLTGWSYGGFMTMWAVTQTSRFRAAVAGAGISNWQSYYGENDIDQWMIPFFGASAYDDPAIYAKSSAINFIKNVKTPTLIVVGDRDGECPLPQSFEFWHALKTLGVETQFVVYPNEGHEIAQPEHRRDILRRVIAWFNQHLQ